MANTTTLAATATANKPAKVFRIRGLSVSVFPNCASVRDREVTFHKVSFQRTYKDGDQFKFKTTTSLGRDDLLPVAQLLHQAWEWIVSEEGKGKGHEGLIALAVAVDPRELMNEASFIRSSSRSRIADQVALLKVSAPVHIP